MKIVRNKLIFLFFNLETSDRTKIKSKNRFLVSKKYNNKMIPAKFKTSKDSFKSYLGHSMKFESGSGAGSSMAKYKTNNTHIIDIKTPTSSTSHKINPKSSLTAKKKICTHKKGRKTDYQREEVKNYKTIKTMLKSVKNESKTE